MLATWHLYGKLAKFPVINSVLKVHLCPTGFQTKIVQSSSQLGPVHHYNHIYS